MCRPSNADGLQLLPSIRLRPEGEAHQSPDASPPITAIDQALDLPPSSIGSDIGSVPGPRGSAVDSTSGSDR